MPTSPVFPSLPMPRTELEALYTFCMSAKQAIEQMQHGPGQSPRIFVQDTPPAIIRNGDFWLSQGTSTTLNVSLDGQWIRAGTLV